MVMLVMLETGMLCLLLNFLFVYYLFVFVFTLKMSFRLPNALGLYKWLGANILLLEYRGFGLSEGKPSEWGLYADAKAALNYLHSRNDINSKEIILFGRSLGNMSLIFQS